MIFLAVFIAYVTFLGIISGCSLIGPSITPGLISTACAWEDSHRGSCLQDVTIGRLATARRLAGIVA